MIWTSRKGIVYLSIYFTFIYCILMKARHCSRCWEGEDSWRSGSGSSFFFFPLCLQETVLASFLFITVRHESSLHRQYCRITSHSSLICTGAQPAALARPLEVRLVRIVRSPQEFINWGMGKREYGTCFLSFFFFSTRNT